MKEKTDSKIAAESSRFEFIAICGGVAVIAGLGLEVLWSVDWHLIVANVIIGLGVSAEVLFGRLASEREKELRHRAEMKARYVARDAERALKMGRNAQAHL